MIKQLLVSAAVAAMAFSVSAEKTVLWTADSPEGEPISGWHDFLTLNAEEAAVLNAGDIITVTVTSKGTDGWPQVALFEGNVGWPPMTNAGAGDCPCDLKLSITYDMAEKIHENGATIKGESVYVSEISYESASVEVGPNTIWFGPKQCNWGDAVGISKDPFANVKPGDKIVVNCGEGALQIILGGWSGLNLANYDAWKYDFMNVDGEQGLITLDLVPELASFEVVAENGDVTTYDAFTLLRDNGLVIQGPCMVNTVEYIPVNYYAVGGFQDWNVEKPAEFTYADGVFTLVAEKASTMKISTLYGNWDAFNSATIAPTDAAVIFNDGSVPFAVTPDYEFVLEYQASWTVTINPMQQSIKFATEDPRPVADVYLRGSMNGWGAVDEWKFSTTDGNLYTLDNVSIEAGKEFKVADADWGTVNYGGVEGIAPNTTVILTYNAGNCSLSESVENANIEFNLAEKTFKVSTGTGIATIGTNNASATYYNLQGAKVANPVEGNVYIVIKGSEVSKVAF